MLKTFILTALGFAFYDYLFGLFVFGFWLGFVSTIGYLYYIFLHNPAGTAGWFMTDWSTPWLILSPFNGGVLMGAIIQYIPVLILEKEL